LYNNNNNKYNFKIFNKKIKKYNYYKNKLNNYNKLFKNYNSFYNKLLIKLKVNNKKNYH